MTQNGKQDEPQLREELRTFGFSDKEIDVYLALLSRGEATTSTISEDADVSQQAVYSITDRLEKKGLVQVKDYASPTTIRALPPQEAIGNLSSRLESLTPSLDDRFNDVSSKAPEIQIVKSRETALKRLRNAIGQAEKEAIVAVPESIYPEIETELRAALARDVQVFLLLANVETMDRYESDATRFAGAADAVRCWDAALPFFYAVDDESAMIGDPNFLTGPHMDKESVTVSQRHLTGAVHGVYLSAYWPASTEVYVSDPDPLPRTYEWFRQAVFQAFRHQQLGTDLTATVTTKSGEEFSGVVSRVKQAFVEPTTNDYTLEVSLSLETDDGEVSFGGPEAFIEDYEATSVTLSESA
ncbi:TrmB family transcriptional regulator [Haloarchaeobius sp. TZWSO28]|uniref:TrmB family transcriptional regulator n=1 Tax=unclassified Haloarchaeobius TaxID=2614452 RepID=UPI003EBE8C54